MLPHIRQIQRLDVDGESGGQSAHWEEDVAVNGMGTVERDVFGEVGCEERRV